VLVVELFMLFMVTFNVHNFVYSTNP